MEKVENKEKNFNKNNSNKNFKNKNKNENKVENKIENKNKNTNNKKFYKHKKNIKTPQKSKNLDKMYVIPLGGLEEVGKNTTVFQYKDEIILVDSGALFPDDDLPGIDLVIADYTFLENNKDLIKGVFLTHGHEDHIGGLPYLYEKINFDTPMYGGKLTNALIKSKFENFSRSKKIPPLKETGSRSKVKVGKYFTVEFVKVTHSIADSYCLSIKTPAGHIFHTGDFKIDLTPVDGEKVDFVRMSELGEEGVDLLLSDSTNSEVDGFTPSEKTVGDAFRLEFAKAKGRLIVASFASHVHRLQQIIDIAVENKRKIAIDGRSLVKIFEIAPTVGKLHIPNNLLVPISKIAKFPDNEILIVCTGTQGEPFAALSRIAKNMHKHIKLREKDTVIISSTPIPGNEKAVSNNINNLLRCEAEVVFKKITGIHVSGHGSKEEQKLMLNLINPKFFMPVHGEYRMLKAHMKSAIETGVPKENIILTQNGDKVEVTKEGS
ncbi:MAG: ribonuclease J, partial [Fusobacterium sp.]|nr:ribonuclease J [Fusobacterium sp.]